MMSYEFYISKYNAFLGEKKNYTCIGRIIRQCENREKETDLTSSIIVREK